MKFSVSYRAQEVFDKALASSEPDPSRPITGKGYKVWVDEPTGTLCKVSTLSGTVMGFVSVGRNHPWFSREDCPLPGISSYGTISHPVECRGLWWFYFALDGNGRETIEKTMQKCRILAAQLEIEGTELAQQISQLKRVGSEDDGEDENVVDDKFRSKVSNTSEVWGNCNPSPGVTPPTEDPKAWENCTLTEFPTLIEYYERREEARDAINRKIEEEKRAQEVHKAFNDFMDSYYVELGKYVNEEKMIWK